MNRTGRVGEGVSEITLNASPESNRESRADFQNLSPPRQVQSTGKQQCPLTLCSLHRADCCPQMPRIRHFQTYGYILSLSLSPPAPPSIHLYLCVCVHTYGCVCPCTTVHVWKSTCNLWELVLSFYCMIPRDGT